MRILHEGGSGSVVPARQRIAQDERGSIFVWLPRLLQGSAIACLTAMLLGQLLFASYVLLFYGVSWWRGEPEQWNRVLPHGHVTGDTVGNLVLASHLLFAFLIMLSGALQCLPWLRRAWPAFHRWNGRVYMILAYAAAAGGLWMLLLGRGAGDLSQQIAIAFNALLIFVCATQAWRLARARRFDRHQRWALRLLLATAGVWFFRILLMLWIMLNQGPRGFDPETFSGPALTTIAFAQTLLPLALFELYAFARERQAGALKLAAALAMCLATLIVIAGTAAAGLILWLPRL